MTSERARRSNFNGYSDGVREKKSAYSNGARVYIKLSRKRVLGCRLDRKKKYAAGFGYFRDLKKEKRKKYIAKKFCLLFDTERSSASWKPAVSAAVSTPKFTLSCSRL